MEHLIAKAAQHTSEILRDAMLHETGKTLIIYDEQAPLTRILTAGYRKAVPDATFMKFEDFQKQDFIDAFEALTPGDLVIQIQSGNFRLDDFRIRIFLFKLGLKAIEHVHLNRYPEEQFETYIDALHYDPAYYHKIGYGLKEKVEACQKAEVCCGEHVLTYGGPFERVRLNIGDYRELPNTGGTFPIGEVFTEPQDLSTVNGECLIYGFAGMDHLVKIYDPFVVHIENGRLRPGKDAPEDFIEIINLIEESEPVHVREFGLGMNPAIRKDRILNDMTACERITGLHLSLGGKHSIYKKPGMSRKKGGRYHIDVFVDSDEILLDGEVIYKDWTYII